MLSEATIRREMNRLYRLARSNSVSRVGERAYEAAAALQWALGKCREKSSVFLVQELGAKEGSDGQ